MGLKLFVSLILIALSHSGIAQVEEGNPIAGKEKSKLCRSCHGEDGNSINQLCPNLAGQLPEYIEKQIHDFQTRDRTDSIMTGISLGIITEQDAKDIAAYFGGKKIKAGTNQVGKDIFHAGKPDVDLPACASCHGENGKGKLDDNNAIPMIGGQIRDYIARELKEMRKGSRHNDKDSMMRNIAQKLSDEEINALADYISGL